MADFLTPAGLPGRGNRAYSLACPERIGLGDLGQPLMLQSICKMPHRMLCDVRQFQIALLPASSAMNPSRFIAMQPTKVARWLSFFSA
ncbi:hypothetical protein [Ruegeria sp. R14_0]|uniref:hypothetical protein n=1 Tax=Ruegeria sp. R14_0 TaxID=2821100 RepID=UPI001ADC679C|nr:hypothetical protein [Ruegeria sp. R14_0]MBO9445448.1 hypothetical protein [Ruegeria sp. R14_0]